MTNPKGRFGEFGGQYVPETQNLEDSMCRKP